MLEQNRQLRQDISSGLTHASKSNPCPHCGKPDWCYSLDELTVCKRDAEPATGWQKTSKCDKDGTPYYAPSQQKTIRPRAKKDYFYPGRDGSPLVRVTRIDDGLGKKSFPQSHWNNGQWNKGNPDHIKRQIPIYRYQEVRQAIAQGQQIFIVEGEGVADVLSEMGLAATTFIGGAGKYCAYGSGYKEDLAGASIVLCPDRDHPGIKHMEEIAQDFPDAQWMYAPPSSFFWANLPKSQGLDVGDWVRDGATVADILQQIGDKKDTSKEIGEIRQLLQQLKENRADKENEPVINGNDDDDIKEELSFDQKAFQELYADSHWICVNAKLYRWEDTYYKVRTDGEEQKRIQQWCNTYSVEMVDSKGNLKKCYPYAKNINIKSALEWAKQALYIHPDSVNQAGINCLNGILQITWDGEKPNWDLVDHDPTKHFFNYPPLVEYNPKADSYHCDRLLDALDPAQRDIFLKVVAASIDLPNVRRFKGRLIRALLLKGTGANGKDALKEAIATIFGKQGMTSCTLSDFQQYDDGRRFPLSSLAFSRINWASENTNSSRLDRVQSLKAAITGNTLTSEAKGKDGVDFTPNAVFLFNINDVPNLQGALEAILSRYAVISFNKTYKVGADPTKGELEADPRFSYDPVFLKTMVCPSLLNKMLDALVSLMREGIDYDCTKQALQDIQSENSHLWQFIQETGLGYAPNSYLTTDDIWQRLRPWYIESGTLTFTDSGKEVWSDQVRPSDKNVKALNQVLARFKQLFPQSKQASIMHPSGKKRIPVLHGVAFGSILNKDFCTAISENPTPIPPQSPPQQILTQQALHPNHPNSPYAAEKKLKNDPSRDLKRPDILQNNAQSPNQAFSEQCPNLKKENEYSENWGGWGGTLENTGKTGVGDWGGVGVEESLIAVQNGLLRMDGDISQQNKVTPETSAISETTESEKPAPAFKVGDRVTVKNPYHARFGQVGEISKVVSDELVRVTWQDGRDNLYEVQEMEFVQH